MIIFRKKPERNNKIFVIQISEPNQRINMVDYKYLVLLISLVSCLHGARSEDQAGSKCKQRVFNKLRFYINLYFDYFTVLSCSVANATAEVSGCPKLAKCIENTTSAGAVKGSCVCDSKYEVNENYSSADNKSQYCTERKNETQPIDLPPSTQATKVSTIAATTTTLKPEAATPATTKPTEAAATTTPTTNAPTSTTTTKKPESDKNDVKVAPAPEPHHVLGGILLPIFIVLAFIGAVFAIKKYDLIERAHGYVRSRNQQARYNGLMENDFDDDPVLI